MMSRDAGLEHNRRVTDFHTDGMQTVRTNVDQYTGRYTTARTAQRSNPLNQSTDDRDRENNPENDHYGNGVPSACGFATGQIGLTAP
jgi:hypothetical protein